MKRERVKALLEYVDIVAEVGRYVALAPAGENYKGLCPFHREKSPNFVVSPKRQSYHCFGCGASGNALTFVAEMEEISHKEAAARLEQHYPQ